MQYIVQNNVFYFFLFFLQIGKVLVLRVQTWPDMEI